MSISNTTRKAGPYTGNGSTTQFPFSFKVFSASDVRVVRTDSVGAESDLGLGTDYTVALNADQDANPGGTVTATTAPAVGYLITITSQVQNLQPVSLTNQGAFYPKVINDAFDRLTILVQQVAEQVGRAVKVDISSSLSPSQLIADLAAKASAAVTSAAAALASQNAAATSATNAATSASGAATSATNAATSATSAATSATTATTQATTATSASNSASSSATSASNSALAAAGSATTAVNAAASATTPVASTVAAYLDNFIPTGQLVSFSGLYVSGGWDLGGLVAASPFPNEAVAARRASLSAGSGSFNFGTVP